MKSFQFIISVILMTGFLCSGCGAASPVDTDIPFSQNPQQIQITNSGTYIPWGNYQLEIARDGSYANVVPQRYANVDWGYHLNALKLLEASPCTDCLQTSNLQVLPNGDISIDVSIIHPYNNPAYTGFDVRGIIMFPALQEIPDNELLALAGFDPWPEWHHRYSSCEKGDAELMNPDGWTSIWAPDAKYNNGLFDLAEGFPIFEYYPGKFAAGENLGTINAFKRFYSNENRHMFEVGETVTRTYIIRPPAEGPIEASYAIYAHWDEPLSIPVIDPSMDFGPKANSPLPYEF